jgi:hypothetical protein
VLGNAGASLVEFALVAPLLLTVSLGGVDYGTLLNGSQSIAAAARVGAETARNNPTCQSGIQILNNPQVSNDCFTAIKGAMASSGNFSPALSFPGSFPLTCKCDGDDGSITCGNHSCQTAGRGFNEVFITISATQDVSPLVPWPAFPSGISGSMTVRLQ